jgi:ABC-type branched-subunit amino acid transport system substrate-binding protein
MDGWDSLAYKRPMGDPCPPVFVCVGPDADEFVRRYRDRLAGDGGSRATSVPHALVEDRYGEEAVDDLAFFDEVANGLARGFPSAMGELRLDLYWTLRQTLDVELDQREHSARRQELLKLLYEKHRERVRVEKGVTEVLGPNPSGTGVADSEGWWQAVVSFGRTLGFALLRRAFAGSLRRRRRFRALAKHLAQATKVEDKGFLDAALVLVRNGSARHDPELVRQMLMLALLQDLDAATTPSLRSPKRRRRTTPFVLLFPSVGRPVKGATGRFLDTFLVLSPTFPRGTILILASTPVAVGPDGPETVEAPLWMPDEVLSVADARMLIDAVAMTDGSKSQRTRMAARTVVGVEVPTRHGPGEDFWLNLYDKVVPHPGFWPLAVPVAFFTAVAVVVGTVVVAGVVVADEPTACSGVHQAAGSTERVGLGDGSLDCTFFAHPRNGVEEKIKQVEQRIAQQNQDAIAAIGDRPYVEVVFFAPLTSLDAPERSGHSSLRELRGVALAQAEGNGEAVVDQNKVPVVVRLANAGDSFGHGLQVARQIVEAAERDDRIVGVVGISQSREVSRQAIRILEEAELPVITGTATADEMIHSSETYYQIAPRNRRIAEMMATFTHHHPTVHRGTEVEIARNAVIVTDHSDEYSENLAADLQQAFSTRGHEVIGVYSYPVADDSLPLPNYPYEVTQAGSLGEVATGLCANLDLSRDVVLFTGRAQQFVGLLNALKNETDCSTATQPITIVAGDTLTRLIQEPTVHLESYPFLRLYYAAFGAPSLPVGDSNLPAQFVQDYTHAFAGASGDVAVDISDPALNYDAFQVLQEAINQVYANGPTPTRQLVAAEFKHGQIELDGVTGYLTFGPTDEQRVPSDKPVFVIDALAPGQPPLLRCGRFTEQTNITTWGPDNLPCPPAN